MVICVKPQTAFNHEIPCRIACDTAFNFMTGNRTWDKRLMRLKAMLWPFKRHHTGVQNPEDASPRNLVKTEAEIARAELSARLLAFASENIPPVTDDERAPKSPADWDAPKESLLCHAAVSKYVRVLATVCAVENYFRLHNFEMLNPVKYLDEIYSEMRQCQASQDFQRLKQFESTANAHVMYFKATPLMRAIFRNDAKVYRDNVNFAAASIIGYCKWVVSEWLQQIPADNFRELLDELEWLETAKLSTQLKYFRVSDFILE